MVGFQGSDGRWHNRISAELVNQHDPGLLRAMLAAFFDEMRKQIQALGGTVENYAGDVIVAVFGAPRVSEDDAARPRSSR